MSDPGEGNESGNDTSTSDFLENLGSEMGATREEARAAREESRQAREVTSRMREVFAPKQEAPNELGWYDDFLDTMLEAEKANRPMPLTGKLGTVAAQTQQKLSALERVVQEQAEVIKKLQNPSSSANQRAFADMDDSITTTLEGMYGEVPIAFHDAVSSEVEGIIKTLMREHPDKWEQIRRSTTIQKRLVSHCAQKLVPPKAREYMLEKHESERPATAQDFTEAVGELRALQRDAAQGKGPYSTKQLEKMETDLRIQAREFQYNGAQKYNDPRTRRR